MQIDSACKTNDFPFNKNSGEKIHFPPNIMPWAKVQNYNKLDYYLIILHQIGVFHMQISNICSFQ